MIIKTKKICAAVLSAVMAAGMIPISGMTVLAEESEETEEQAELYEQPDESTDPEPEREYNVEFDEETGTVTLSGKIDSSWWRTDAISEVRDDIKHVIVTDGETASDASMLFYSLTNVETIDVSNLDTSDATDMSSMFALCLNLEEIDLTNFDTSNVTRTEKMFADCASLVTIKVGNNWYLRKVQNSTDMFLNCTSIQGDFGTTYMPDHVDAKYAQTDYIPVYYCYVRYNDVRIDGYSLILEGSLTFRVFLKVPEDFNIKGTKMRFTVGNAKPITVKNPVDYDIISRCYYYYCPITAVQMADTIKSEFIYGEGGSKVSTHKTSVQEYLNGIALRDNARPLAEALLRYGYYSQQYLSRVNEWTIGDKYTAMNDYSYDYDIDNIRGGLTPPSVDSSIAENFNVTASLSLEENVTLTLKLTAKKDRSYNLTYEDGRVLDDDGRVYTAVFKNINQAHFNDEKVVYFGYDKISISVNSFIKTVLDNNAHSSYNNDYCMAMCALCDVGTEAKEYVR